MPKILAEPFKCRRRPHAHAHFIAIQPKFAALNPCLAESKILRRESVGYLRICKQRSAHFVEIRIFGVPKDWILPFFDKPHNLLAFAGNFKFFRKSLCLPASIHKREFHPSLAFLSAGILNPRKERNVGISERRQCNGEKSH